MDVKYFDVIFSSYEYIIYSIKYIYIYIYVYILYDSNLLSMKNNAL